MKAHLADLVLYVHFSYVAFVIAGFAVIPVGAWLKWGWIRSRGFRITHLVCTCIVPVEALVGVLCPLTVLEARLREEAGQRSSELSFMARLVRDLLFVEVPQWVLAICYVIFGSLVVGAFYLVPPRPRRGAASPGSADPGRASGSG